MNLAVFWLIIASTKRGMKTASMYIAHHCKHFLFFFHLEPRSTPKNWDSFHFHWSSRKQSFYCRIISNFECCTDAYVIDVTMKFFNQNKCYIFTDIFWQIILNKMTSLHLLFTCIHIVLVPVFTCLKIFEIRLFQTLKYDTKAYYLQYYVDNVFKSVTHW